MASGQPELRSLSFILWRRLWMATLGSLTVFLRRFISMADALSLPRGRAYFVNSGSDGFLFVQNPARCCAVSFEIGIVRSDVTVLRPRCSLLLIGSVCCSRSISRTNRPVTSATRHPVSLSVTNKAAARVSFKKSCAAPSSCSSVIGSLSVLLAPLPLTRIPANTFLQTRSCSLIAVLIAAFTILRVLTTELGAI